MEEYIAEIGSLAFSKMGRDAGRYYIIVKKVDENYVHIVDGKHRKLEKPKLKKVKHLRLSGHIFESIAEKLKANKQVFDSEIYSALRAYNED